MGRIHRIRAIGLDCVAFGKAVAHPMLSYMRLLRATPRTQVAPTSFPRAGQTRNSLEQFSQQHKSPHWEIAQALQRLCQASCGRRRNHDPEPQATVSEATVRIPRRKLGAEHTSNRSNRDRNVASRVTRILVNADMSAAVVHKALTLAIHMRRTR